ncbi:MAG: prepilin-type N-terminal cleavage/methylation domain-containing protein [Bacillota bacterium]|nr:prepilin-type N-terminal cleavage/methylation domain-containing protein [Bacillota bacterium]
MTIKKFQDDHGFTLVELMVTLALLGIVLALGYLYFGFGVQAFQRGERQSIAQQAVRLTSDFITSELRFAKQIEINPEGGISETGYRYIYQEDDSIYFRNEEGNDRCLADSDADGMPYSIIFTSNVPEDVVIFTIEADNGLYTLQSSVQALNLELYRDYNIDLYGEIIKVYDGDDTSVKYTIPPEE